VLPQPGLEVSTYSEGLICPAGSEGSLSAGENGCETSRLTLQPQLIATTA